MSKIVQFLKLTVERLNTNNFIKSSIDTMTQGFIKPKALNPTQVDKEEAVNIYICSHYNFF